MKTLLSTLLSLPFTLLAQWQMLDVQTQASYRSMSLVNDQIIWAGGSANTVLRSIDSGQNWQVFKVGEGLLDFRGIKAFDESTAIVVSAGLGEEGQALIFKTTDGGQNWKEVFQTREKGAFLDGIAFFDEMHGLVIGDPINGKVYLLETFDQGESWKRRKADDLPKPLEGEASFAASNSGIVAIGKTAYYAFQSRIFKTTDAGLNWEVLETEFPQGKTKGIFGLKFWSEEEGVLLGGDYANDKAEQENYAFTKDGGITWKAGIMKIDGLKESADMVKGKLIAVGTSGTSISNDQGKSWKALDSETFHVIRCAGSICYAVGPKGRIAKMAIK